MTRIEAENLPITEVNFTQQFVATTAKLGFQKVGDLLALTPQQIINLPDFTFKLIEEYREFLTKNRLDNT
ncbi:MAG: hypothetical protein V4594_12505 [Bacteroidota bacterium]